MSSVQGSRSGTYGMLAELFIRPPDAREVDAILGHGHHMDVDELAADFTDLLRAPRPSSPTPPYESLHLEGVMMGKATEEVNAAYQAFGLSRGDASAGEPADHISLELDFMRHLCDLEMTTTDPDELQNLLEAELRFLSEHLSRWVGSVRGGLEGSDRTGFYTKVAEFAQGWVSTDMEHLRTRVDGMGVGQ